jgi:hypothetical protein
MGDWNLLNLPRLSQSMDFVILQLGPALETRAASFVFGSVAGESSLEASKKRPFLFHRLGLNGSMIF